MFVTKIAASTMLLACAFAGPLAKRSEGIHLVNCVNGATNVYSEVVYCVNDGSCNFNPSSANQCITPGGIDHWEGGPQACTFSTGTTFDWVIAVNAQSEPNFSQVGNGTNGFHNFNIMKDDKHTMFVDGNGNSCESIYYCLDA